MWEAPVDAAGEDEERDILLATDAVGARQVGTRDGRGMGARRDMVVGRVRRRWKHGCGGDHDGPVT